MSTYYHDKIYTDMIITNYMCPSLSTDKLQLHLRPFSSTGLNLRIPPPHNKDGVNYTCTLSPGNKTIVTSSGDITPITDLSPNTTYSVRCLVFKNGEDLCYEGITNGSTFPSGGLNL